MLARPVRLANDANCFALSEATDGAAAGAAVAFGVILGTGVGGGLVVHGRILEGAHHIAGEWGHNPLPAPHDDERPGPACYCGRHGCIETFLSGPGWAEDTARRTGRRLEAMAIASAASDGDPEAASAVGRYADRLARALATVINVVDPDVIVLGGGLSNIDALYEEVPRRWARARLLRRGAHAACARPPRGLERRARRRMVVVKPDPLMIANCQSGH